MKLVPITYQIMTDQGPFIVSGFAVDTKCGVRICVRELPVQFGPSIWTADHYDTGYRIGKGGYGSAKAAVYAAVSIIERNIASGQYEMILAAIQADQ